MVGKWRAQKNDKLVNSDDKEYCFQHTTLYTEQTLETIKLFTNQKPCISSFSRNLEGKKLNACVDRIV